MGTRETEVTKKNLTKEDFCGIVIHVDEMQSIEWKGVDVVPIKDRRCNVPNWAKVIERIGNGGKVKPSEVVAIARWRTCAVGTRIKEELGTCGVKKFFEEGYEAEEIITKPANKAGMRLSNLIEEYYDCQNDDQYGDIKVVRRNILKTFKRIQAFKTVVKKRYQGLTPTKLMKELDNG